jgi:hypothetical protein
MTHTATAPTIYEYQSGAPAISNRRRTRPWKRWALVGTGVAAAALAAAVAVVGVPGLNQPASAEAAVLAAADRTAKETAFRSTMENTYKTITSPPESKTTSQTGEFNGSDFRLLERTPFGDHVYTGVGKKVYETFRGETTVRSLENSDLKPAGDRPFFIDQTFAEASR